MHNNEEYLKYNATQMVSHIKKCHPKYQGALPDLLEQWVKQQIEVPDTSGTDFLRESTKSNEDVVLNSAKREFKQQVLLQILSSQRINGMESDTFADYCVELTEKLIERLER